MNLFGKLLIAALVLAVLLPFTIIKGKDGKPLMSFSDIKMPGIALPDAMKNTDINAASGNEDIIYKWKDEKGELHFSSSPPPTGIEYTAKGYDPNTNLIQSVKILVEEPEQLEKEVQINKASDIGNPYSPGKVDKLIKDAQNIEKLLNDRLKKQQALID